MTVISKAFLTNRGYTCRKRINMTQRTANGERCPLLSEAAVPLQSPRFPPIAAF